MERESQRSNVSSGVLVLSVPYFCRVVFRVAISFLSVHPPVRFIPLHLHCTRIQGPGTSVQTLARKSMQILGSALLQCCVGSGLRRHRRKYGTQVLLFDRIIRVAMPCISAAFAFAECIALNTQARQLRASVTNVTWNLLYGFFFYYAHLSSVRIVHRSQIRVRNNLLYNGS